MSRNYWVIPLIVASTKTSRRGSVVGEVDEVESRRDGQGGLSMQVLALSGRLLSYIN